MRKYLTISTVVATLAMVSCSGSGESGNAQSEAAQENVPSDSTHEADENREMKGDTTGNDRSTGSFGAPGSGYGTANESGTSASGTSAPAGNAAADGDEARD